MQFTLITLYCRLLANGLQGLMFSVMYKYFMEMAEKRRQAAAMAAAPTSDS